ncbi:nucleotidyltransferase domain-containing protein [Candidatus Woesearchaeota archaeon]|nr:nucleotidyltransferase domain-containing protein [Candidatus Woesearchaeota archaeon]
MKIQDKEVQKIAKIVVPILKKYDVVKAGIFGSYARGEAKKRSDVDILIKQKGKKSLLDLVRLEHLLEEKLKKNVDLLDYEGLSPYLKERILKEEVRIL